jgi:hypothetical protein
MARYYIRESKCHPLQTPHCCATTAVKVVMQIRGAKEVKNEMQLNMQLAVDAVACQVASHPMLPAVLVRLRIRGSNWSRIGGGEEERAVKGQNNA